MTSSKPSQSTKIVELSLIHPWIYQQRHSERIKISLKITNALLKISTKLGKINIRNSLRNARVKKKAVKLTSVSAGHVIGLNYFLFKSSKKFFSMVCTSKVGRIAKMHSHDISANLNTIEISQQLKIMVYNNLSVLGESLNNAIKLENLSLLSTSTVNISNNDNFKEISRTLEGEEENVFYERLKSLKIVSPIKEIVRRHNLAGVEEFPISFYK